MNQIKEVKIILQDLIDSKSAISTEDGNKLAERIDKAFKNEANVEVSFKGIEIVTSSFLNAGIGQLFGNHDKKTINDKVKIIDIEEVDLNLLNQVKETADKYFKRPNQKESNKEFLDESN